MIKIANEFLEVMISEKGAELQSIKDKNEVEYLWQGNPEFWSGRATNLFPFVGRLTDGHYTIDGVKYPMGSHGFARNNEFMVGENREDYLELYIKSNDELKEIYPFDFKFSVIYELVENKLNMNYKVVNTGDKDMYFGVGGHPGFNIPIGNKGEFTDYFIEYATESTPVKMGVSPNCFMDGKDNPYPLLENKIMKLKHELYDDDAIILKDVADVLTIKNNVSAPEIEIGYPNMKYLATWHAVKKAAPYICIEPWTTLPSREGVLEELSSHPDMNKLSSGSTYENKWWIKIKN